MASFWINGQSGIPQPYSWQADPDYFFSRAGTPGGLPSDWMGVQRGLLVNTRVALGGVSGGTSARAWVANTDGSDFHYTGQFGITTGNASIQSYQNFAAPKGFIGGQEILLGVDQLWGSFKVGRAPVGGRNVESGNPSGQGWGGHTIVAEIGYWALPTNPGTPIMNAPGAGMLNASWSPPSWDGDTPILRYGFDIARDDPYFTNYSRIPVSSGNSISLIGLTPGVYYTRVVAYNAVADAWGTHSLPGGTAAIVVPGAPPAPVVPTAVVKVSIGGVWVQATAIRVSIGGQWVTADMKVSVGGNWVTPVA